EVIRSKQVPEVPVETFVKVPVDFEITGTFMQIKKFFASLIPKKKKPGQQEPSGDQAVEERERIVSIENLKLENPTVKNREIVLTAKFTAMTYRQEDQVAVPGKPAATAPAGAGSAQPPANTPAGAKARTDDAMDKSDQRAKSATDKLKEGK